MESLSWVRCLQTPSPPKPPLAPRPLPQLPPPSLCVRSLLASDACRRPARPSPLPRPRSGHMKQPPTKNETTSNQVVCMPVAGRVTGCGRAGRAKEGRYHPPPSPSLPPLIIPPLPSPLLTRCGADDWSCWQARSLSPPPPPAFPLPSPISPVAGRVTG